MGVVTAGWRDQPPKAAKVPSAETSKPPPAATTPEPAAEPAATSAATSVGDAEVTRSAKTGADAHTAAAAAAEEPGNGDRPAAAKVERSQPLQDEDLFYMDEAEAIRQIEKEIEEQIERNHYKAMGI